MSLDRIAIVGTGRGGLETARAYREHGGEAELTLFGKENYLPYRRPPLSREFLRGELDIGELAIESPEWFAEHELELRLGCEVTAVDADAGIVKTARDGISVDAIVLATGAEPLRPELPGLDHPRVATLRDLSDSERIAAEARDGIHTAVLGSGFIGCEIAGSLALQGAAVTLVGQESAPQRVPGFWSTIGAQTIKYAAWGDGHDGCHLEERCDGAFITWYFQEDTLVGVLTHEYGEDYERGQEFIAGGEGPPCSNA